MLLRDADPRIHATALTASRACRPAIATRGGNRDDAGSTHDRSAANVASTASNWLTTTGKRFCFPVDDTDEFGLDAPPIRRGEAAHLDVRWVVGIQKEARVRTARGPAA